MKISVSLFFEYFRIFSHEFSELESLEAILNFIRLATERLLSVEARHGLSALSDRTGLSKAVVP